MKWHDLIKNPNDLPTKSGWYYLKFSDKRYKAENLPIDTAYINVEKCKAKLTDLKIIAWAEKID